METLALGRVPQGYNTAEIADRQHLPATTDRAVPELPLRHPPFAQPLAAGRIPAKDFSRLVAYGHDGLAVLHEGDGTDRLRVLERHRRQAQEQSPQLRIRRTGLLVRSLGPGGWNGQ